MLREDARIGMPVVFGRNNGEKTHGVITKLNLKMAKVRLLEARGSRSQAGATWGVAYSLLTEDKSGKKVPDVQNAPAPKIKSNADAPIEYNVFQDVVEQKILEAICDLYWQLSPEWLIVDGELSQSQVATKYKQLQTKLGGLFMALVRGVSEDVAYARESQKRQANKKTA